MIDLWYLNVSDITNGKFILLLETLPREMRQEIMRFKVFKDRCLKLFGKLIVKKYHQEQNGQFSWANWKLSANGKPYYGAEKKFNISHSGNYVSVAFSNHNIGVDIEKINEIDVSSISSFLHPKEAQYIQEANNSKDALYQVWTRKEAYLKARGVGIVEGLNLENCLEPYIINDKKWFLTSLNLLPDYKLALCSEMPNCEIEKLELKPAEFFEL